MQYMLMCCFQEHRWERVSDEEKVGIMKEYREAIRNLVKSGHCRGGSQLHPTSTAITLRMVNGKAICTDGPFAETKEQLGGYHLVACGGLDEAIAIAARIPTLPGGGAIEVRPVAMQAR